MGKDKIIVVDEQERKLEKFWSKLGNNNKTRRRNFILFFWLPFCGLIALAIYCGGIQAVISYFTTK